jgi:hypothetical protein
VSARKTVELYDEPAERCPPLTADQKRTARALRGKRVKSVRLHPFAPSNGGPAATDPVIVFTDGSSLAFGVDETEMGEYGVSLCYRPARKPAKVRS